MTEYSWKIDLMVCAKNVDGLTDVVRVVKWFRIAVDGKYAVSVSGTTPLLPPDPAAFIPFNQLTEQEVKAWLDSTVDTVDMDAMLDVKLQESKIVPQEIVVLPPWISPLPVTGE